MTPDLTQLLAGLLVLTLVPVAVYALDRSAEIIALSVVCVLLVVGSLYLMFGPTDSELAGRTA